MTVSFSSGANPVQCEILIDGKRCVEKPSHVFKSTFATRLVCDGCARRYRDGEAGAQNPLLEFSAELVPARNLLLDRLDAMTQTAAKVRAQSHVTEDALAAHVLRTGRYGIGAIVVLAIVTKGLGLAVVIPWLVLNYFLREKYRKGLEADLASVDKSLGFPELRL